MNLGVYHAGALGDCVLAIQTASCVAASLRVDQIELIARSGIARWAARHGWLHAAHSLEGPFGKWLFNPGDQPQPEFADSLRGLGYVLSFLGGPADPISQRLMSSCRGTMWAIDPRLRDETQRNGVHITQQWLTDLAAQGCDVARGHSHDSSIPPWPPDEFARCRELLVRKTEAPNDKSRIILIHPGGGGRRKCLPLEVLKPLRHSLSSKDTSVAWIIGPDEWERDGSDFVKELRRTAPVVYEESIEIAADLVSAADLYVGNDAGMTHAAALVGVPTIALFGPTDSRVWKPLGDHCVAAQFPPPDEPLGLWVERITTLARPMLRR